MQLDEVNGTTDGEILVLTYKDTVIVGFKEAEWNEKLNGHIE